MLDLTELEPGSHSLANLFPAVQTPDTTEAVHLAAQAFLGAREAKRLADDAAKRAGEAEDRAEQALMAILTANKIPLWVEGQFKLSILPRTHYSVLVDTIREDKKFRSWLKKAGGWDLVKETMHPQSFAKFCRELVEAGKKISPSVRVAEQQQISVRRD
jgi:hypothetical protein